WDTGWGCRACAPAEDNRALVRRDEAVHDAHRLLGLAGVVAVQELNFLAEDPAGPVDFLDDQIDGLALALAIPGRAARHRPEDADLDRLLRERRAGKQEHDSHQRDTPPHPCAHRRASFALERPASRSAASGRHELDLDD